LAPFWLPKCLPLGTLLALQIDQKNDPKSDCLQGRSKIAPRAPKTLPRRPPEPPGMPQDPPRGLPDLPRTPSGCPKKLPGSPRTTQNVFRSIWPNNLFRKNRKIRNRRKHVEKKVDIGLPRWSLTSVAQKSKALSQRSNTEGGGGGRAKRSSIRRPQRSTACCRSIVNISCFLYYFKSLEGRRLRSKSLGGATRWTTTAAPRRSRPPLGRPRSTQDPP
jgi:hypothetical protein